MKLELDLEGLSPTCRDRIINSLSYILWENYSEIDSDIGDYVEGEAKREMQGWGNSAKKLHGYVADKRLELRGDK